jgi:hypothetical protein
MEQQTAEAEQTLTEGQPGFSRENPIIRSLRLYIFEDAFSTHFERYKTPGMATSKELPNRFAYATENVKRDPEYVSRTSFGHKDADEAMRSARYHLEDAWQKRDSGEWHRDMITEVVHGWPPREVFIKYMDNRVKAHYLNTESVAKFLEDEADKAEKRVEQVRGHLAHGRAHGRHDFVPPMIVDYERRLGKKVAKRCRKAAESLLESIRPYTVTGFK